MTEADEFTKQAIFMTKPEYKQDFHYKVIRKRFNADFASKKILVMLQ